MHKVIDNFMHYRYFLKENVTKDIKLKYRNSYLGIIWTMIEPLLQMVVLAFVFGTLFGNEDKQFPVYILTGRLLYSFFSSATKSCVRSIRSNSSMIKKVYVPKYLYPLSSILSSFVIFLISLIVLVAVGLYFKVVPTVYTLLAPVPVLLLLLLSFGIGMILATFGVFFRDLEYLWGVALMLIMYTCAIFYKIDRFNKSGFAWVLELNPLYCIIKNFRNVVLYGQGLDSKTMLYALAFSVVTALIGLILFNRQQDKFILHI